MGFWKNGSGHEEEMSKLACYVYRYIGSNIEC
jgi:hypothetical protein